MINKKPTSEYGFLHIVPKHKKIYRNGILPSLLPMIAFFIAFYQTIIKYNIFMSIVFFLCFAFFLFRLMDRRPKVIVDWEGIRIKNIFLTWGEISDIYIEIRGSSGSDSVTVDFLEILTKSNEKISICITLLNFSDYIKMAKTIETFRNPQLAPICKDE